MKQAAAHAAASSSIPGELQYAQESLPAFEDRAVKEVLKWIGKPELYRVLQDNANKITDSRLATFDLFHQAVREFYPHLTAGRLRFNYDGLATDLFNEPRKTVLWSAWTDAQERLNYKKLGLVFTWPRVKRCRGWMILHNCDRNDEQPVPWPRPYKPCPEIGFRLTVPIQGRYFSIEPLPAFLASLGWLRGNDESD